MCLHILYRHQQVLPRSFVLFWVAFLYIPGTYLYVCMYVVVWRFSACSFRRAYSTLALLRLWSERPTYPRIDMWSDILRSRTEPRASTAYRGSVFFCTYPVQIRHCCTAVSSGLSCRYVRVDGRTRYESVPVRILYTYAARSMPPQGICIVGNRVICLRRDLYCR